MAGGQTICGVVDWGREPYGRVFDWQRELVAARKAGRVPDLLLLGEHTPVVTLGRNARREHVRLPDAELARRGVEVCETDRGGDVTYHGPGQLVGYPILDLAGLRKDLVWYVRSLEEVLIRAAGELGVEATRRTAPAGRRQFYTGVWVGSPESGEEKLAAIGVHVSRWVTSHGFAFNVTTDLSHFDFIVPCGIGDKGVTSLEIILESLPSPQAPAWGNAGQPNPVAGATGLGADDLMGVVKAAVVKQFGEVFEREMRPLPAETLSRAQSRDWEAWVGAQQAAAS